MKEKKIFKCQTCPVLFSTEDVEQGFYFPSTGICLECYREMKRSGRTCFGKVEKFDLTTNECGHECPDRNVCRVFIEARKAA